MTHCPKSFHAPCAGALARPTTQGEVQTKYLGRPVSRSGDAFAYNPRGEVTNVVVGGDAFRYDNNGNVIGYWNEDGDLVAEYAYDAFGNTISEDGKRADKLAAEKLYLLPSYGFVEKFPPVTGIAWDVRRYKRVWEKK